MTGVQTCALPIWGGYARRRVVKGQRGSRYQTWQSGSEVGAGDLNTEDPGSNPRLGLLNGFVLGDTRGKFITLCK